MKIDIDTIIDSFSVFSDNGDMFHNSMGISDNKALFIMEKAEDIVYNYIEVEDDSWEVGDVAKDLLYGCKFHQLNSPEAFFFLIHGMHFLLDHLEPTIFMLNKEGYVGKEGIEFDQN